MKHITLALLVVLASVPSFTERADAQTGRRTVTRTPPTAECPITISGIADCPDSGCGENGDVELNKAKNRVDVPSPAAVETKTLSSIRSLAQPSRWNTGDDRTSDQRRWQGRDSSCAERFCAQGQGRGRRILQL